MKKTITVLLITLFLFSCSSTKEYGVIKKTDNYRIVKGNAKNFQMRYDAKLKREGKLITTKN